MQFKDIIGNEELKQRMTAFVTNNRLPHALMLCQEGNYGAFPLALALVQYLNCPNRSEYDSCGVCSECNKIKKLIHPDIHFVFPIKNESQKKITSDMFIKQWTSFALSNPYFTEEEHNKAVGIEDKSGVITVNESSSIISKMSTKSYQGGNKCVIVLYPEKITQEAANKLLKMIEEPYPKSYFIFISQAPEKIITTIRSRNLILNLAPQELPFLKGSENTEIYAQLINSIFNHCFQNNLSALIANNEKIVALGRERQKDFCKFFTTILRKAILLKKGLPQLCKIAESEQETVTLLSNKLTENSIQQLFKHIETSRTNLENNVNAKMVFLNLSNLIFLLCSN